ncbi:MAG: hypothetical protein N3J91_04230 [Verrucomicrobiae bacterium]|nr:hypothetical protein [Verrucomicrobiae bacterium]
MKKLMSWAVICLNMALVAIFTGGCARAPKPKPLNVCILKKNVGQIEVDLVAVPLAMVEKVQSMNVDEWFDNPKGLRQTFKEKGLLRELKLPEGEKFQLRSQDPEWGKWIRNYGVTHLVILADLNRQVVKKNMQSDIRMSIIDLRNPAYKKAELINVEVVRDAAALITTQR